MIFYISYIINCIILGLLTEGSKIFPSWVCPVLLFLKIKMTWQGYHDP